MSDSADRPRAQNRLAGEKSPYLLQHAENPVDWFPWGEEAFAEARRRDVPVFLSVGYSACHWCHVMAHESFEDADISRLLNSRFVSVKVDREERPDIDHLYMAVCQALTGRGGWPLSAFLLPDGLPFFAGTYFPPRSKFGMTGFFELLGNISVLWRDDRTRVVTSAGNIAKAFQPPAANPARPDRKIFAAARNQLAAAFDKANGGFGQAPKFPTPHQITFLLAHHAQTDGGDAEALEMALSTLDHMDRGGIHDHLGGGFHRYSVDEKWLVPHFEKMLYDQAGLADAYLSAFELTGDGRWAEVAKDIFGYVLRDLTSPEGAFFCAEDADSEGEEGLFYAFTQKELKEVLGENDGAFAVRFFDVSEAGNFEKGKSVLSVPVSPGEFARLENIELSACLSRIESVKKRLYEARNLRPRPLLDDKVLTGLNGLMMAALAHGAMALSDDSLLQAAKRAARFIENSLVDSAGRLLRRHRGGESAIPAFLEDYAYFTLGLIEIHRAGGGGEYLEKALHYHSETLRLFGDESGGGGLYLSGLGNEPLFARNRDAYDGAVPSGNSVAVENGLVLSEISGDPALKERALSIAGWFAGEMEAHPTGFCHMLKALYPALGKDA